MKPIAILIAVACLLAVSCSRPQRTTGVVTIVRPLPTAPVFYMPTGYDPYGQPDGTWCRECVPILIQWPIGATCLSGVSGTVYYPKLAGNSYVKFDYEVSVNMRATMDHGIGAGDVIQLDLAPDGINWWHRRAYYGSVADSLDTLRVLGGLATVVAATDSLLVVSMQIRTQVRAQLDTTYNFARLQLGDGSAFLKAAPLR